jgi:methylenetetrahydrofolate reductase (NADPH)
MKIKDRLAEPRPCFSFEFFPPKTDQAMDELFRTIHDLARLEPGFVSVTYGAMGQTRSRTIEVVTRIKRVTGIEAMAHVTCAGHSRADLRALLDRLRDDGVENVLALRGDPPKGEESFVPPPDEFAFASELVEFIRSEGYPFCVGAAAYPEGHLESSREEDLVHLKRKVDAGVDFLITQVFFDNAFYFDFLARAREAGIEVPIVPGIMPITNFEQVERFTRICGATIPMRLRLELERCAGDPAAISQVGVAHATVQCMELLTRGVRHLHFFTLNKSPATRLIVSALKGAGMDVAKPEPAP